MEWASPSYIQSDYMTTLAGEQIAEGKPQGSVLHPTTEAKLRREQAEKEANAPRFNQNPYATIYHNFDNQFSSMDSGTQPLPYSMRSATAPYTLNYPYANNQSMAWGMFDATFSAQATPFKTALATSSLIILGAIVGELTVSQLISKKADKVAQNNKLPVGMGALIGGITANALRMAIASQISSGWKPALTSLLGGIIPVTIPIGLTLMNKDIKKNQTKILLGISGALLLSVPFIIKKSSDK